MTSAERSATVALSDDQRVFVECIEDILASMPELRYAVLLDPQEIASRDRSAYALFLVETNPVHDLSVAIELAEKSFTIRLNGTALLRRQGLASRFEWWVDRRCRDVERMLAGDLRLTRQMFLNIPLAITLHAGRDKKWRKIASRENGILAALTYMMPYGFLLGGSKETVYTDWFAADGPP